MAGAAGSLALTETDPETLERLLQQIDQFEFLRITYADLNGSQRGMTFSSEAARRALESGGIETCNAMMLLGPTSQLPEMIEEIIVQRGVGNGFLLPDPLTVHRVPWAGGGGNTVAEVLCESYWLPEKAPQMACPRYVCRQQLARLQEEGYKLKSGFEVEFILEDAKTGVPVFEGPHAMTHICLAPQEDFLFKAKRYFECMGINIERFHTEYSSGMFELTIGVGEGVETADSTFVLKHGLKELASRSSLRANFMSKPSPPLDGSSLHFNHSLWTMDGQSAFYDATKEDQLSDVARHWLAGLLAHGKALTALCSPSVNCYRRLHKTITPHLINWVIDDRLTSTFRVKNNSPKSTLIENRLCGGVCNPYLVIAANVAAGLDGVRRQLECPPARQEGDVEQVPHSLEEAIAALEADRILVEALGENVIDWFVQIKRQIDLTVLKDSDVNDDDDQKGITAERAMYSFLM